MLRRKCLYKGLGQSVSGKGNAAEAAVCRCGPRFLVNEVEEEVGFCRLGSDSRFLLDPGLLTVVAGVGGVVCL